ncbi:MAG TPA: 50S ribosomal protein L13 [Candidatus Portnoybacteria bacterium]|nr:50S ribosomal protein L13 [Candidatus Portnoybacteria bacterium]
MTNKNQKSNQNNIYEIDAKNQSLGRIASKATVLLRGKNRPDWAPNLNFGHVVIVKNLLEAKFTGNKLKGKIYYRHSGYPGGLKERSLGDFFDQNPQKVLTKIIYGMLPKNKLRDQIIKNLRFGK